MSTKTEAIVHWMDGSTARIPADRAAVVVPVVRGVVNPPEFFSLSKPSYDTQAITCRLDVAPWGKRPEITALGDVVGRPCGPVRMMSTYNIPPAIYVDTGEQAAEAGGFSRVYSVYRRIRHSEWPAEQKP